MASNLPPKGLRGKALLYSVSTFASLGVFLFGYDQGVMSGIITGPYFKAYFKNPDSVQIGTMVSVLEIGAFVTSLIAGWLADKKGRTFVICLGSLIFTIGGSLQTFTTGYYTMVLGRVVSGFGVGFLSMIVPVYQSEVSPAHNRGLLGAVEFTGNIIGYASSVWIDYFCTYIKSDMSWRFPLSIQCAIGIILAVGALFIPESPRHLIATGQDEDGLRVIAALHGLDEDDALVLEEFKEIQEVVEADNAIGDRSYSALWRRYKGRVLIAMSSQMFAQLNGINVISYYAPLVFEQAGWIGRNAILMTGINALIYVLSTIPTWFLIDRVGRRPILLSGAVVMALALTSVGYFMYLDIVITPNAVVASVIIFNAAFGMSWGPIPWLYPPEIMPLAFRAKGVSISTATNWAFNFLIGEITPVLQELIAWRLYPMHAFWCLCSFAVVYFLYPETCGVPLEEMNTLFGDEMFDEENSDEEEEGDEGDDDGAFSDSESLRSPSPDRPQGWIAWLRGKVSKSGRGDEEGYKAVDQPN
ncbi:general substrate transporter [Mrakia frigida]|uniref:sugar porter family MFS transporter n=1 Tax=Mrakia frigida TaxID=29902 RepID=UPI003FCC1F60